MLISVINQSRTLPDADVVTAIRALNRQLAEDFFPYWSREGRLRFDGIALSNTPLQSPAQDLRGDAVIYLWDDVAAGDPLGYHELHHSGIPYGFVFLGLAAQLGEPWTVTLSHEALELLMDPEVNLLVKGPHPDPAENGREVFHWYEMCDAVQDETYEIDGVAVSNFLLPLYFTLHEEDGRRNDFLGTQRGDGSQIPSFGVNPGGYVGFYDPLTGRHETHTPDQRSRARQAMKERAKLMRRAIRYQQPCTRDHDHDHDHEHPPPASVLVDGGAAVAPARCESIIVELAVPTGERALNGVLETIVAERLPGRWKVSRFSPGDTDLELTSADRQISVAEAWDYCHSLIGDARVRLAEPLFEFEEPGLTIESGNVAAVRASSAGTGVDRPGEEDKEWALKTLGIDRVFALDWDGRVPGEGVLIGHPDTGYTENPELLDRLDLNHAYDFVDDDADAKDPLDGGNEGHGTSTGTVLASRRRREDDRDNQISGAAPGATLIPLRVNKRVVLLSMRNLIKAIARAVDAGSHVISISMGGLHLPFKLKKLISEAVDNGTIVICAAGNRVKFVVSPAFHEDTIAVAGSNIDDLPWSGSSRGERVDVTAPGENVWRSRSWRAGDRLRWEADKSSGTSYATALTAGVAALWLSFHGREALIRRYGRQHLTAVFRALLKNTCRRPDRWDTGRYGSGIVDAHALLTSALPDALPPTARAMAAVAPPPELAIRQAVSGADPGAAHRLARNLTGPRESDQAAYLRFQELAMFAGMDDATFDGLESMLSGPTVLTAARVRAPAPDGLKALIARLPGSNALKQAAAGNR